jgi:pimeloyl-ACP methyl ester carboxylesterase
MRALESDAYEQVLECYWTQIGGPDQDVRARLLRDLRATPRRVVVDGFASVMRFDARPLLAAYRGPTRAVVTPLNASPASLHALGGFEHVEVQGTGHWLQLDRPAEFDAILDRFLSEVEPAR